MPDETTGLTHPEADFAVDVPAFAAITRIQGTEVHVQVRGDLDCATAPVLDELLTELINSGRTAIVVDLTELSFLGVAGLNVLLEARQRAGAAAGHVVVVNPDRCARRVLSVTGLDNVLLPRQD